MDLEKIDKYAGMLAKDGDFNEFVMNMVANMRKQRLLTKSEFKAICSKIHPKKRRQVRYLLNQTSGYGR